MATVTMSADSTTLILNGTTINDFVAGETLTVEWPNESTSHIIATQGGVAIQERADAAVGELTLNLLRNSEADIFMNSAANSGGVTLFNGSMKEVVNRDGNQVISTVKLENGAIMNRGNITVNDTEGNTTCSWKLRFRTATRAM